MDRVERGLPVQTSRRNHRGQGENPGKHTHGGMFRQAGVKSAAYTEVCAFTRCAGCADVRPVPRAVCTRSEGRVASERPVPPPSGRDAPRRLRALPFRPPQTRCFPATASRLRAAASSARLMPGPCAFSPPSRLRRRRRLLPLGRSALTHQQVGAPVIALRHFVRQPQRLVVPSLPWPRAATPPPPSLPPAAEGLAASYWTGARSEGGPSFEGGSIAVFLSCRRSGWRVEGGGGRQAPPRPGEEKPRLFFFNGSGK